jgi:hypothetical protein
MLNYVNIILKGWEVPPGFWVTLSWILTIRYNLNSLCIIDLDKGDSIMSQTMSFLARCLTWLMVEMISWIKWYFWPSLCMVTSNPDLMSININKYTHLPIYMFLSIDIDVD